MSAWRLSILAPLTRLDAARRLFARQWPLAAASAALAASLLLGWIAPAPLMTAELTWVGMAAVAGLGLLAWLFARLTILPLADPLSAALAASLISPVLLPGVGDAALLVPASLALWAAWRRRDQRVVALMVQCGALAEVADGGGSVTAASMAAAILLGFSWLQVTKSLSGAANDNPQMERMKQPGGDSRLPGGSCYANRDSIPGKWGVS